MVYQTKMVDGILDESPVSDSFERVAASFLPDVTDPEILADIVSDYGASLSLPYDLAYDVATSPVQATNGEASLQLVLPRTDLQLRLPAENLASGGETEGTLNVTLKSIATTVYYFRQTSTLESMGFALSDSKNISATFENAARLMSNRIREIGGSLAKGEAQHWDVYVRIRWAFLAFPVLVSIAGFIFAVGAVVDSRKLKLEPMKTDLLSVLVHGLDDGDRAELRKQKEQGVLGDDIQVKVQRGGRWSGTSLFSLGSLTRRLEMFTSKDSQPAGLSSVLADDDAIPCAMGRPLEQVGSPMGRLARCNCLQAMAGVGPEPTPSNRMVKLGRPAGNMYVVRCILHHRS